MAPRHDLTLRLTGLPNNTTKEAISNFLQDNKIDLRCIQSIGQPCLSTNDDDCTATVTFWGAGAATKARNAITRKSQDHVRADMEFQGMSTIYSSDNPFKGKPDVDIVAVHGLEGHAYNSWTYTECIGDGRWKEVMWLRDLLPRVAESRGIHPRVMTFGYNARVFHDITVADIGSPAIQLLHCLDTERKGVSSRPLLLIGHSLGGIIIKQLLTSIDKAGKFGDHPIGGCLFFGTPHIGSPSAGLALKWLKPLDKLSLGLLNRFTNLDRIRDLQKQSDKLMVINREFLQARATHDIPVLSCVEQKPYLGRELVVNLDSANLKYEGCQAPFPIDANHSDMIKFSNPGHQGFSCIADAFIKTAEKAIPASTPLPRRGPLLRLLGHLAR